MSMRDRMIFLGTGVTAGVIMAVLFTAMLFEENLKWF